MINSYTKLYPRIRELRANGLTYAEINEALSFKIPKSSLSYICKDIQLSSLQKQRIVEISKTRLTENQKLAVKANRRIFENKLTAFRESNIGIKKSMNNKDAKLIALAMLYLGEGTKWKGHRGPILCSSDPMIINMYIKLLRSCYGIKKKDLHCRIQHRWDQDVKVLTTYWAKVTGLKIEQFYLPYADPRTKGKVTKKQNYHGVCSIICSGTHVQLELEQIAVIINESLSVGH